jgi:hypothetical protein
MSLSQLPRGAIRRVRRIVAIAVIGSDHGAHCACCASARPCAAVRVAAPVRPPVDLLPPVPIRCRRRVGLHLVRLERRRAEEAAERRRVAATAIAHAPRLAAAQAVGRRAEASRRAVAAVDAAIAADTARARWRGVPHGDGLDDLRADLAPLLRHLVQQQQRRGVAA